MRIQILILRFEGLLDVINEVYFFHGAFPEERYSERRINIKLTVKITCLANEEGIHCL